MLAFFLGSTLQVEVRLGAKKENSLKKRRQYACQGFVFALWVQFVSFDSKHGKK